MRPLRHLGFALWLAIALVAGQHLALLHDLGHAAEQLGHKQDSKPNKCDKHFASTQLVGAAPADLTAPLVACEAAAIAFLETAAVAARPPAYRSRAPPTLL